MSALGRDVVRKAIFITGGGSGIGQATARLFAGRGWFVGLADINEAGMQETAAMLPTGQSSCHKLDVRFRDKWQVALDDFAKASGGRLDVLFNNAGVGIGGSVDTLPPEEADFVIDVNLRGVLNGIYMAMPLLRATNGGACILNTASAAGLYGSANMAVYSATKFAVRGITESLDIEYAAEGIRVRDLMPSFIDTPLLNRVVANSNHTTRDVVREAGLDFTPVEQVAQAAWDAVHGDKVHTLVGKTAHRLGWAARWIPGRLHKRMRQGVLAGSSVPLGR